MQVGSELFSVVMTWMKGHSASSASLELHQAEEIEMQSPVPGMEQLHAPGQPGNQVVEKEC